MKTLSETAGIVGINKLMDLEFMTVELEFRVEFRASCCFIGFNLYLN